VKQLKSILQSTHSYEEKERLVRELIGELGEKTAYSLLAEILLHPAVQKIIIS
jgi:hypothetical protein